MKDHLLECTTHITNARDEKQKRRKKDISHVSAIVAALFVVVSDLAPTIANALGVGAVLDESHGDVIVVRTRSRGVDAGEAVAHVPIVVRVLAGARAALFPIEGNTAGNERGVGDIGDDESTGRGHKRRVFVSLLAAIYIPTKRAFFFKLGAKTFS